MKRRRGEKNKKHNNKMKRRREEKNKKDNYKMRRREEKEQIIKRLERVKKRVI